LGGRSRSHSDEDSSKRLLEGVALEVHGDGGPGESHHHRRMETGHKVIPHLQTGSRRNKLSERFAGRLPFICGLCYYPPLRKKDRLSISSAQGRGRRGRGAGAAVIVGMIQRGAAGGSSKTGCRECRRRFRWAAGRGWGPLLYAAIESRDHGRGTLGLASSRARVDVFLWRKKAGGGEIRDDGRPRRFIPPTVGVYVDGILWC